MVERVIVVVRDDGESDGDLLPGLVLLWVLASLMILLLLQ